MFGMGRGPFSECFLLFRFFFAGLFDGMFLVTRMMNRGNVLYLYRCQGTGGANKPLVETALSFAKLRQAFTAG